MSSHLLLPRHGLRLRVEGFDSGPWREAVDEFVALFREAWKKLPAHVKRDVLACWRLWAPLRTARLLHGRNVYPRDAVACRPLDKRFGQHECGRVEFDLALLFKHRTPDGIRECIAHELAHAWLFATGEHVELQSRGAHADGRDAAAWWHNPEETRVRELTAQWGFGALRPPKVPDKRDCHFRQACRTLAPV